MTYPAGGSVQTNLSAGSQRQLTLPPAVVRFELLRCLRELDFETTSEQFTAIEATRGSRLGGLSLAPTRMPISIRIGLDADGEGVRLSVHLHDRWSAAVGRGWGPASVYARVFADVLAAIDTRLARIDPGAAETFGPWWGDPSLSSATDAYNLVARAGRAEAALTRRTSRIIDGPQRSVGQPVAAGAGLAAFSFVAPDSVAEMSADDVDGVLTAGQLIAGRPGQLPANLVVQVQMLVSSLESHLAAARTARLGNSMWMSVTADQIPVVTFLHQQSRLREELPLRTLQICDTCRLEKVVNPDLTRLRERSRRMKTLTGSLGVMFGSHQVSPYILIGRLVQMKKMDPDFVCARCQGMDADESLITFCAQCGDRRSETVLRTCPKCSFDFRTLVKAAPVWRATEPQPLLPAAVEAPSIESLPDAPTSLTAAPMGWYADPWQQTTWRYWDGVDWTGHTA